MGEAKLLLCGCFFAPVFVCMDVFFCFFWPLTQIIKVVALRILCMFWTRDRREGSSLSFHFLWHSSTFSLMGSVCARSLLITPHRNTSTMTSFWRDISNNMPYTVMHRNRCHVCSSDSCFSRPYAAACFYHLSPLLISLETLLFILGHLKHCLIPNESLL